MKAMHKRGACVHAFFGRFPWGDSSVPRKTAGKSHAGHVKNAEDGRKRVERGPKRNISRGRVDHAGSAMRGSADTHIRIRLTVTHVCCGAECQNAHPTCVSARAYVPALHCQTLRRHMPKHKHATYEPFIGGKKRHPSCRSAIAAVLTRSRLHIGASHPRYPLFSFLLKISLPSSSSSNLARRTSPFLRDKATETPCISPFSPPSLFSVPLPHSLFLPPVHISPSQNQPAHIHTSLHTCLSPLSNPSFPY